MIRIGHLQVSLEERTILSNGAPLRIGDRAFDILALLIQADGALVPKDEIMRRVWPNSVVEENNIQVHVGALRRILESDRDLIYTVPGRGYRLVAPRRDASTTSDATLGLKPGDTHFTSFNSTFVGRQGVVADIIRALEREKIVTLVGAGGIGKTRIAFEVAARVRADFPGGVILVSLATASNERFALDTLAAALEMPISAGHVSLSDIIASIVGKRCLFVLDNCEHLIDAVAQIVSALSTSNASLQILATSREALRIPTEWLYQVVPLDIPDEMASSEVTLQADAVQLFTRHARAAGLPYPVDDRSISLIGLVCRRLDGIPLAIELAAARAAVLGIKVLADHLDDHFRILTGGYRTALPRHQTLKATLDWSYRLLDDNECKLLRWLGVFMNEFTFEAAFYVAKHCGLSRSDVLDALGGLVSKSLVIRECGDVTPRYRLLTVTRAYATQQLEDFGEHKIAARAHANYLQHTFDREPWVQADPTTHACFANSSRLRQKVAFVIGGARGIGVTIVRRLASEGAAVAFTYRCPAGCAKTLVAEIESNGGRALALQADVADAATLRAAISEAGRALGRIDILVNNADTQFMGLFDDFSLDDFDKIVGANVRAVFVATRAVLPHMGRGGRIINVESADATCLQFSSNSAYAMSKSALRGLMEGLARDLRPNGITINNVQSGTVNTQVNLELGEFAVNAHDMAAVKHQVTPEDVAGLVAYAVISEAAFVTGNQCLETTREK
jgi:predicted ATPase/DNA-binding winged helix-turn-helix (wHTH) protein